MKPTQPINVTGNPNWRYRKSGETNVAETFRRLRREAKEREREQLDKIIRIKVKA